MKCKANKLLERRRASPCCSSCCRVIANPFCSTQWLTHSTVPEGAKRFFIHHCLLNDIASSFPRRTIRQPTPLNHFHRVTGRFLRRNFHTSCEPSPAFNQPQVGVIISRSGQQPPHDCPQELRWRHWSRERVRKGRETMKPGRLPPLPSPPLWIQSRTTRPGSLQSRLPRRCAAQRLNTSGPGFTQNFESLQVVLVAKRTGGVVTRIRKTSPTIREWRWGKTLVLTKQCAFTWFNVLYCLPCLTRER